MKNFFEFLGFLATALLTGAAFFLYLGHTKNLPERSHAAASSFTSESGIEYDDAPESVPESQPKKRKQLPDFERITAYPAGEIPTKPNAKKTPAARSSMSSAAPKPAPASAPRRAAEPEEKPKIALAYVAPERRESAKNTRPAAAKTREKAAREIAEPKFVSSKTTPAELTFREMVAREQGFRSWSQLQGKGKAAQKSQAAQRVKVLLASSRIR